MSGNTRGNPPAASAEDLLAEPPVFDTVYTLTTEDILRCMRVLRPAGAGRIAKTGILCAGALYFLLPLLWISPDADTPHTLLLPGIALAALIPLIWWYPAHCNKKEARQAAGQPIPLALYRDRLVFRNGALTIPATQLAAQTRWIETGEYRYAVVTHGREAIIIPQAALTGEPWQRLTAAARGETEVTECS